MNSARTVRLGVGSLLVLGSCKGIAEDPGGGPGLFQWLSEGGGDFGTAANWEHCRSFNPADPNPMKKTPGANDVVAIEKPVVVTVGTAMVKDTILKGELSVGGTYTTGELSTGEFTLSGGGTITASPVFFGVGTISGPVVNARDVRTGPLTLTNRATLKTSGTLEYFATHQFDIENGATWEHEGTILPTTINLSEGNLKSDQYGDERLIRTTLVAGAGSTVDVATLHLSHFVAEGGSVITASDAFFNSDFSEDPPIVFRGAGTQGTHTGALTIGGNVDIEGGAKLTTNVLAFNPVTEGVVRVENTMSKLNVTGAMSGRGALRVMDAGGAEVAAASDVSATVDGPGSEFHFRTYKSNTGFTRFEVLSGGLMQGGGVDMIAGNGLVDGAGSHLRLSDNLQFGQGGNASVVVSDQGRADCESCFVGSEPGGNATMTLRDAGSFFLVRRALVIGDLGGRGRMIVSAGARAQAGAEPIAGAVKTLIALGLDEGAEGELIVTNANAEPGSTVFDARLADGLAVGEGGRGTLRAIFGGRVLASEVFAGFSPGSEGTIAAMGGGSSIEVGKLSVGTSGKGTMEIGDGAIATADEVTVGEHSGEENRITVDGTGSELQIRRRLFVGNHGKGIVHAVFGAKVRFGETDSQFGIGVESGGNGVVTVEGAGSEMSGDILLLVGGKGQAFLRIAGQGMVSVANAVVGTGENSDGLLSVNGSGSRFDSASHLAVGGFPFREAAPGRVWVSDGGEIYVRRQLSVSRLATVSLQGEGGRISIGDDGVRAEPDTVRVGDGGVLQINGKVEGGKIVVDAGGSLITGASPGIATIEGGAEFRAGSSVEIEIAGNEPGVSYDLIEVDGDVAIAGDLTLRFRNGFAPEAGDTFDYLVAESGTITGNFGNVRITGLEPGFESELTVVDGRLRLTALNNGRPLQPVTPPPDLSIRLEDGVVIVSWPPEVTGWHLQSSSDLSPNSWRDRLTVNNELTVNPFFFARDDHFRLVAE